MIPVLFAAREGYTDVLDFCACVGGNVSVVDSDRNNILHLTSLGGHVPMVKYIVSQNITDINSRDRFRRTPVMLAAAEGHTDVFVFLVSKGGKASLVDTYKNNVLHLASLRGHLDMVTHILSQNIVDINGRERYGRTPLMSAATGGNVDVFRSLVSEGSNASLVDRFGDNILHLASLSGHVDLVGYILSQNITDINSRGSFKRTPLMNTARGHVEMVKHILQGSGVGLEATNEYGWTPRMYAQKRNKTELIHYLNAINGTGSG
ncbi:ankyrin repeat and death domain-containing protein 1B-like [Haliotis rubra]|uniref:ankyrin repeat and death domain-containing protein 1B-like n=1 Tax=Haliotis rubra TaxID=36100 RepID=UPI001EE56053|nr:ankyrin repeat and death domain-containing protein 1B-like [Haliotis rubra]